MCGIDTQCATPLATVVERTRVSKIQYPLTSDRYPLSVTPSGNDLEPITSHLQGSKIPDYDRMCEDTVQP